MFGASMASAADLAGIDLFDSLEEPDLESIASWFSDETAAEGVRLCGEGASGYSFSRPGRGQRSGDGERQERSPSRPGDYFGEIAMLDGRRRSATVTTTAPARLLVMFGSEFRQLQQAQPQIADRIEETMRGRLARTARPSSAQPAASP